MFALIRSTCRKHRPILTAVSREFMSQTTKHPSFILGKTQSTLTAQRLAVTYASETSIPTMLLSRHWSSTPHVNQEQIDREETVRSQTSVDAKPLPPIEVESSQKNVRGSPIKLNIVARQIRGLAADEALRQLKVSARKKYSEVVAKALQNAINLADINHELRPSEMYVYKAFVGRGSYMKRIRYHGRGRHGMMWKPHMHVTIVLREYSLEEQEEKIAAQQEKKRIHKEKQQKRLSYIVEEHKKHAGKNTKFEPIPHVIKNLPPSRLAFWSQGGVNTLQ